MALVAVIDSMTLGKREAGMFKNGRFPSWHGCMALHANIVNSGCDMVWIGGGIVISLVAGEALG